MNHELQLEIAETIISYLTRNDYARTNWVVETRTPEEFVSEFLNDSLMQTIQNVYWYCDLMTEQEEELRNA